MLKSCFFRGMQREKKLEFSSIFFFLYFLYFVFILASVFLDFFCNSIKLPQGTLVSRLFLICVILILAFFFKNAFDIKKNTYSWFQIVIGAFVILAISIFKIPYPDVGYDTLFYHLICQRPGFVNVFSYEQGFAKAGTGALLFSLCDKAFWYFRFFLGYRLGTVLNSLVLFITYLQILIILDILVPFCYSANVTWKVINKFQKSVFSILIITSHYILLNVGTYMVDAFVIPFVLESLINLFRKKTQKNNYEFYLFALYMGICIAMKLTSFVFVVPLIIVCVMKNAKFVTAKNLAVCAALVISPCLPFLVHNYQVSGNPVFPLLNNFFKSKYFPTVISRDYRWGPQSKRQALFWILNFVFHPENRCGEIPNKWRLLYMFGLFGGFYWFVAFAQKPKTKEENAFTSVDYFAFVTIGTILLWSFTNGYVRYFEVGMIFLGVSAYYLFENFYFFLSRYLRLSVLWTLKIVFVAMLVLESASCIKSFVSGREWSWRHFSRNTFSQNFKMLLRDRKGTRKIVPAYSRMTFCLTEQKLCGVADSLFPGSRIVNAQYIEWYAKDVVDVSCLLDDETVYDVKSVNFQPDEEYLAFFKKYALNLKEENVVYVDCGDFKLLKFEK